MRRLVILGGGTAGTMVANKLRRRLPLDDWRITVIDGQRDHLYQPGLGRPRCFHRPRPAMAARDRREPGDDLGHWPAHGSDESRTLLASYDGSPMECLGLLCLEPGRGRVEFMRRPQAQWSATGPRPCRTP
jgi:hypothetical protein